MLDIAKYITDTYYPQGNGNGYDQLKGDWGLFYKVARYFVHKVKFEDREDFLHDLMLEMAKVKAKYEAKGKPLTEAGLMRVASYELTDYWVKQKRLTTWLDCGNCSKEQRRKCREELLYEQCPKFHQLVSLNTVVGDGDGHKAELIEFLADDKAIDLDGWVSDSTWGIGYKPRLVEIAYKLKAGLPLANADLLYLSRYRRQEQKSSFD